jgi:hypothetical protein
LKKARPISRTATRLGAVAFFFVSVAAVAQAELPRIPEFSISSPAGSYLAARTARQARDMAASATYYRAVLRTDPTNADLLETTFLMTLGSGAVEESIPLAERVAAIDKTHRIARLVLAARAIKTNQFAQARTQLGQANLGPIADLTATLLTGWSWYGSNNFKQGVAAIDRLPGPEWYALFKDLHAG